MPAKEDSMNVELQPPFDLAILVTGGDAPDPEVLDRVPKSDRVVVIGADSGAGHALSLGLVVDIAVGDFDSIDTAVLDALERDGVDIRRHSVDKDATDLELALDVAIGLGVEQILLLGGHGGRLDHLLGNAMVLADARYCGVRLSALMGSAVVTVVHPGMEIELTGVAEDYVSVLAVHGPAHGVHLEGLLWSLDGATLAAGTTLGISNRFLGTTARIRIGSGTVLVIQPGGSS
jgi:thiamine pyrophosphokinase